MEPSVDIQPLVQPIKEEAVERPPQVAAAALPKPAAEAVSADTAPTSERPSEAVPESEAATPAPETSTAGGSAQTQFDPDPEPSHKKIKTEVPVHNSPPVHEMVGGSSVRQYLNQHLTAHLLQGLRKISKEQPENPLRELGEYLIEVSERSDKGV